MKEEQLKRRYYETLRTNFTNVAIQIKANTIPKDKKIKEMK